MIKTVLLSHCLIYGIKYYIINDSICYFNTMYEYKEM